MMRLHLGKRYNQIRSPGRIREIDLRQIRKSGGCGYIIAVEVDEQRIELFDSAPVVRFFSQTYCVAAMAGSFADEDFGGAQAPEQFDGGGDHGHMGVDSGIRCELDQ